MLGALIPVSARDGPRPRPRALVAGRAGVPFAAAQGFTLVEMVIVLVVGALLVGMAVPAFYGMMARMRLEGAFNELAGDLQYARAEALRRRETVAIQVHADGSGYAVASATLTLKTVTLPSDVSFQAEDPVSFDGLRGSAAGAAQLNGRSLIDSAKLRVSVTAIGRVRLCTPDGSFGGYPSC